MSLIDVKCPLCGEVFKAELENESTLCGKCGQTFPTQKGSKYYKSINKIQAEKTKIAMGETYAKVDALLDKGEFYLNNEDFESAYTCYMQALDLTTVDYRVYLGLVYATTKNFSDLEDQSHVVYLKKAIENANQKEQDRIRKIYSTYYKKRKIPKEERDDYLTQENQSKLRRIEELLKDGIPTHFKREKTDKIALVFIPFLAVITLVFTVLSLVLKHSAMSFIAMVFLAGTLLLFYYYYTTKTKIKIYNFALDLFDAFNTFDIELESLNKILKAYEIFAISYINNETETTLKRKITDLCYLLTQTKSKKVIDFISAYPYILKLN